MFVHIHTNGTFLFLGGGIGNLVYRTVFCGTQLSKTHKTGTNGIPQPTARFGPSQCLQCAPGDHRATLHLSSGEIRCRIRNGDLPNLQIAVILGRGRLTRNRTAPGSSSEQGYPDRHFVQSLELLKFP